MQDNEIITLVKNINFKTSNFEMDLNTSQGVVHHNSVAEKSFD